MNICDLEADDEVAIEQVAALLVVGFTEAAPHAWPTMEVAREEVRASLGHDRISRVALDEQGVAVGWIGGARQYNGHVWELHPLVVHPDCRGRGIGRALVQDLERCVQVRGGLTLWLGTDDEIGQTTLSDVDLYPDVWPYVAVIRNLGRHPYEFYRKLGFVIVGLLPDANGLGKPDIFMAKRVGAL